MRSSSHQSKNNGPRASTYSYEPPKRFIGRLQATTTRLPAKPDVDFSKGGSDFRTPYNTSSIGRQIVKPSAPNIRFIEGPRFPNSETLGAGPGGLPPISSLRKQIISHKRSAPRSIFGTSLRDAELKQYSLYTSTRR